MCEAIVVMLWFLCAAEELCLWETCEGIWCCHDLLCIKLIPVLCKDLVLTRLTNPPWSSCLWTIDRQVLPYFNPGFGCSSVPRKLISVHEVGFSSRGHRKTALKSTKAFKKSCSDFPWFSGSFTSNSRAAARRKLQFSPWPTTFHSTHVWCVVNKADHIQCLNKKPGSSLMIVHVKHCLHLLTVQTHPWNPSNPLHLT